jgi:hypothetical protein
MLPDLVRQLLARPGVTVELRPWIEDDGATLTDSDLELLRSHRGAITDYLWECGPPVDPYDALEREAIQWESREAERTGELFGRLVEIRPGVWHDPAVPMSLFDPPFTPLVHRDVSW